jgi:hypothetical protein
MAQEQVSDGSLQSKQEEETDFLAIFWVGAGSSYVRHKDKYQAVILLRQMVVSDWSSVYDLSGKEVQFGIFDVKGHDKLWWDYQVHDEATREVIPMLETATVMLPEKEPDVESMSKEEVLAAYRDDTKIISYERCLGRLMVLGLSERKADDLLLSE